MEYLEVVNENDEVIGTETREKIHREGLFHREIHVWFVTPNREIIFQHRAKDKDTWPDLLDTTVGGHVDIGMTYEDTAIKEIEEETGLKIFPNDLVFMRKVQNKSEDVVINNLNNAFDTEYAFIFNANVSDLVIEEGKAIGFEVWKIDTLLDLSEEDKKKFKPRIVEPEFLDFYKKLGDLV